MKLFKIAERLFILSMIFLFADCIQDEAPNSEADITACSVEGVMLIREPMITNDQVLLYVNDGTDVTAVSPEFSVTDGASLSPVGGTMRNFTLPQIYTVTSQDGRWRKEYTVEFISQSMATNYSFEAIKYYSSVGTDGVSKDYYHIFYDTRVDGSLMEWGSGNAGFMITNGDAPAIDYPTCQDENGYRGKCVKLTTRSTGALGKTMGAPIAAGNLFTGTFLLNLNVMARSTKMGVPFRYRPTRLTGFYKYKSGDVYTDPEGNVVPGRHDEFDIYGVLYEVTDEVKYLDGTNIQTSPHIVLFAQITDSCETDTWTSFSIPFEIRNGKNIDMEKLRSGRYNLALVISSSRGGALFNGSVGSTLCVDEMQLFYETE